MTTPTDYKAKSEEHNKNLDRLRADLSGIEESLNDGRISNDDYEDLIADKLDEAVQATLQLIESVKDKDA